MKKQHARNIKRDKLLSDIERTRLIKRVDDSTIPINDARVRKKLSNWLKNLDDVAFILEYLPQNQWKHLKDSLNENQVDTLFRISEKLMDILGFYGIEGNQSDRSAWVVKKDGYDERGFPRAAKPRPATDKDIKQSWIVAKHELALRKHRTGDKIVIVSTTLPLERKQYVVQDEDPAVMMGFMAQHRDAGATFRDYTPEMFATMDEVAAIIKKEESEERGMADKH